jgi:hypothetical protein
VGFLTELITNERREDSTGPRNLDGHSSEKKKEKRKKKKK